MRLAGFSMACESEDTLGKDELKTTLAMSTEPLATTLGDSLELSHLNINMYGRCVPRSRAGDGSKRRVSLVLHLVDQVWT